MAGAYERFVKEPSVENLLVLTPFIHAYGVPNGISDAVRKVMDEMRNRHDDEDERDDVAFAVFTLASQVAAITRDVELADAIADTAVELIFAEQESRLVQQMFFRLVECSAANPDRETAWTALATRLEFLALRLPVSEAMVTLYTLLRSLRIVEPRLTVRLGRAVAAAKLAAFRAMAA
jgi:hypothetical protein